MDTQTPRCIGCVHLVRVTWLDRPGVMYQCCHRRTPEWEIRPADLQESPAWCQRREGNWLDASWLL